MAPAGRRAFLDGLLATVGGHGSTFFLAEADGSLIGWARVFVRRGVALLGAAEVVPAWRGRGIHRALIAARARQAEAEGALHLVAQARDGSPSARNLAAMGLRPIWTRHDYRYAVEAAAPRPSGEPSPAPRADRAGRRRWFASRSTGPMSTTPSTPS